MRTNFWLKGFPHLLHLYWLAPVWTPPCWLRVEFCLKDVPHSPHTQSLSPLWTLWWITSEDLYRNAFPHSRHMKQSSYVNTLVLNKCVCGAKGVLTFPPGNITFSALKCPTLSDFVWLLSGVSGLQLVFWGGQEGFLNLSTGEGLVRHM